MARRTTARADRAAPSRAAAKSRLGARRAGRLRRAGLLARAAALPLSEWSYLAQPTVRHLGPVAEDSHAAFGLGEDSQHVAALDTSGVALAAIQGLWQESELAALEARP